MKPPVRWESQISGNHYTFCYEIIAREHTLTINGLPQKFPLAFFDFLGPDKPFMLGGQEARLVVDGNKTDIAVDGVFLRSGRQYVKRPAWAWVFIALCMLLPIISLGGALPALFGFGGAYFCVRMSKAPMHAALRAFLCTLITLAVWGVWLLVSIGITVLTGRA